MTDDPADRNDPVAYIERTRRYYRALGYERDYDWARNGTTPFRRLPTPLSDARIALVTTTLPPGTPDGVSPEPTVWSVPVADAPAALPTHNRAWDRESTHTRDRESYLPLLALQALAARSVIGSLAPRLHGAPTSYSHRETMEQDAPEILRRIVADHADAAMLVPL